VAEDGGGGGGRGGWSRGARRGNTFDNEGVSLFWVKDFTIHWLGSLVSGLWVVKGGEDTFEVEQEDRGVSLFWAKVFMIYWLGSLVSGFCAPFVVPHILYSPGSVWAN